MQRLAVLALFVLVQGCEAGPTVRKRPEVPLRNVDWPTLRAECYWLSDDEIETELSDIESDRQLGFSRDFEVQRARASCEGDPDCVACLTTVIDEVYD
ncbi:MAG: hypothetical protein ACYSUQ_02620 [Planctomycetota bacterium]|jgi:hypothetical protein